MKLRVLCLTLLCAFLLPFGAVAQDAFNNPGDSGGAVASGGIKPVSDKVDAGSVGIGSAAQVIVRFANGEGQEVQMKDIRLFPSSNVSAEITTDACTKEAIPAGAECAIVLTLQGVQQGPFRVEMLIEHTGRARLMTATVTGTVSVDEISEKNVGKDIQVDPSPIDFGDLDASRAMIRSVTLRNITSKTLDIGSIQINSSEQSGYDLRTDCKALLAGQACIVSVIWAPKISGPATGVLVINHSGPSRVATASLTGNFKPGEAAQAKIFPTAVPGKGLLVSSETQVDFGSVSSESSITVSLVNTGDAVLKITDIAMTNSNQGIKVQPTGCVKNTELRPTDACPLTLTWTPVRDGAIIDDLKIAHNGARGILVLPIRGSATDIRGIDQRPLMVVGDQLVSSGASSSASSAEPIIDRDQGVGAGASSASDTGGSVAAPARSSSASSTSRPRASSARASQADQLAAARMLESYKITSLSPDRAVISGPGGSRVVRNNGSIRLAGALWNTSITQDGVMMRSDSGEFMLVFDSSFASMAPDSSTKAVIGSDTSSSPSSSASTSSSSSTPTSTTGSATGSTTTTSAGTTTSGSSTSGTGASSTTNTGTGATTTSATK